MSINKFLVFQENKVVTQNKVVILIDRMFLMYISLYVKENEFGFILYDTDFIHLISICLVTKQSCLLNHSGITYMALYISIKVCCIKYNCA